MFRRQWLLKLLSVLLASVLSACSGLTSFNASQDGNSADFNGKYDDSGHARNKSSASNGDNAASADYFNSVSANNTDAGSSNNLWVEIRRNFQLNHYEDAPEVQAQIAWFMHNQGYLDRTARRAAPFMYYIYQEVKARHLPSELVLLPIIESAYNPFVSSSAGAAGLWQIEPGTGRTFGLRQDFWYDGRRDITASTNAALDYLTYLQNFFGGDWLLAIAAYDTGEGNVEAAIRHNARRGKGTDFWSLPLADETESYVPRLLALATIISNPRAYPVNLPPISNTPYLGEVEISSQITLGQAANLAGMSLDELKTLNPGYRRSILDPNQPYKLLFPIDRVSYFKAHLLNQPVQQGSLWGRYKVQPHDTWRHIARRFNTSIGLIQEVNRTHSQKPPVGEILLIPENQNNETAIATATTQAISNTNMTTNDDSSTTAEANQTIDNSITANNDNTSQTISTASASTIIGNNSPGSNDSATATTDDSNMDSNNADDTIAEPDLSDAANLDSGAIKALARQNARSENSGNQQELHWYKIIHTVKPGETLNSIAKSHHISTAALARWNRLSAYTHLKQGMKLTIWHHMPVSLQIHRSKSVVIEGTSASRHKHTGSNTQAAASDRIFYTVHAGDTIDSIARKHKVKIADLEKWNKINRNSHLHAGQHVIIYSTG